MASVFGTPVNQGVVIPNQAQFRVEIINIAVTNTPVNLPDLPIPDGASCVIRAKLTNGLKKIFVANSSANTLDATKRTELFGGQAVGLSITNANLVWINGDVVGTGIELIVEA